MARRQAMPPSRNGWADSLNRSTLVIVITVAFFLSGMAALIYEVVWARYLALLLGNDGFAVVVVLATFMGGLAMGNAWVGPRVDSMQRPLVFFGALEMAVGLYALAFAKYFHLLRDGYLGVASPDYPTLLLVLRFIVSAAAILPPTILMGATLPVLSRFATASVNELSSRVALLYAVNSAGSVIGAAIAGFWWIRWLGLNGTLVGGAALNLVVAVSALVLGYFVPSAALRRTTAENSVQKKPLGQADTFLVIVAIGLSGFSVMLYEVAWTRMLALILGSTTTSFSLMLIAFISGITTGAVIVYFWTTLPKRITSFAYLQLLTAGTLVLSMLCFTWLPFYSGVLGTIVARTDEAFSIFSFAQGAACVAITIVPLTCSGMALPIVSHLVATKLSRVGHTVGAVWSANIGGAVLGALITGLWLMPTLGLAKLFGLGIAINAITGLALLVRMRLRYLAVSAPVIVLVSMLAAGWAFEDKWQRAFTLALWRYRPPPTKQAYDKIINSSNIKYYRDGSTATVSVHAFQDKDNEYHVLRINGKPDASSIPNDMATQLLSGHVPMVLRPESEHVLVIGLGSGVTCGAVSRHALIKTIDVVEMSPEVVEAAAFFRKANHDILNNDRVRVIVDDAKAFLLTAKTRYDVITSEPSNPWVAGVAGVFTREFYQNCRNTLVDDGVMVQWFHTYEASNDMFDVVLATFSSVFPYVGVWQTSHGDLLLVGSAEPLGSASMDEMEASFLQPSVQADLQRVGLGRFTTFLACEAIPAEDGRHIPERDTVLHSDYYPVLEFMAERAFYTRARIDRWRAFDQRYESRGRSMLAQYLQSNEMKPADYLDLVRFRFAQNIPDEQIVHSALLGWQASIPTDPLPARLATRLVESASKTRSIALESQLSLAEQSRDENRPTDVGWLRLRARAMLQVYRSQRSVFYSPPTDELVKSLEELVVQDPERRHIYELHLAELAWDKGQAEKSVQITDGVLRQGKTIPVNIAGPAVARVLEALIRSNDQRTAKHVCEFAVKRGLAGRTEGPRDPVLEMTVRKLSPDEGLP